MWAARCDALLAPSDPLLCKACEIEDEDAEDSAATDLTDEAISFRLRSRAQCMVEASRYFAGIAAEYDVGRT